MTFVAGGALIVLLFFVNEIGTRPLDKGSGARQFESMVGRSLPAFIDKDWLDSVKAARFEHTSPRLRGGDWVKPGTAALGGAGPIQVITFLDPNCSHCDTTFRTIKQLVGTHGDLGTFYVFSRVLWDHSMLQTQALEVARDNGRYFDMWQLQFDKRKRGGMQLPDILALFESLGLNTADLYSRLSSKRAIIVEQTERARRSGIISTPRIFVDGLPVASSSRDAVSLARLLEKASVDHASQK